MWYTECMALIDLKPDDLEQVATACYLDHILQGRPLRDSIEDLAPFSVRTWYNRVEQYPDVFDRSLVAAQRQAVRLKRDLARQLADQRAVTELRIQALITNRMQDVVERILDITDNGEDKDSISAARLVTQLARSGVLVTLDQAEEQAKQEQMPYDPNVGIDAASIILPPGAKITVETPDIIPGEQSS